MSNATGAKAASRAVDARRAVVPSEPGRDARVLSLIRQMLKAKVPMPNGVVVSTEEGTPQGGPLSPLLSNIVLDELDGLHLRALRRGTHGGR